MDALEDTLMKTNYSESHFKTRRDLNNFRNVWPSANQGENIDINQAKMTTIIPS